MFTEEVYAACKTEKHFPLLFESLKIGQMSSDEICKLNYFNFDPDE